MQPFIKIIVIIKKQNMKTQRIITSVLIILAALAFNSCEEWGFGCIDGNGHQTTETRVTTEFDGIEVNGNFDVYVDKSQETSVLIETDENLIDLIKTQVRGNNLVIDTYRDRCLDARHGIVIHVSTPQISELILRGSGRIDCNDFEATELKVKLEGSGDINLNYAYADEAYFNISGSGRISGTVDCNSADLLVEGSGDIYLDGTSHVADMEITGSGSIQAKDFITDNCNVTITGSGNATVFASDLLEARITGSGTVYYYGNPANVVKEISGSGKIIER